MKNFQFRWLLLIGLVLFVSSCLEKDDPAPTSEEDNLVQATATGSRTAAELQFFIQLSGRDIDPEIFQYDVEVYNVVYKTTYKDEEIEASGLVILPKTTDNLPMISFQRGTIVEQANAPSVQSKSSEEVVSYTALASMGFITVVPDMIGFGESKEIFHPYYIEEPTVDAVVDLLKAAATLSNQKSVSFDTRLFLAGYSQGGYSTLATHKALEENPVEGFQLIASFPAAGGYDITAMQEYLFELDTYEDPYYLAYVGLSYQSYYENSDLVRDFFNDPYAQRIPALFDGVKSSTDINAQLTQEIPMLVQADILSNGEANPQNAFLVEKFEENSLVDWVPSLPIYFYHGDADTTVPFVNSELTYETLIANGASPDDVKLFVIEGGDHGSSLEPYITDMIKKLQDLK